MSAAVEEGTRYHIRVEGRLGSERLARLAGMTLVVQAPADRPVSTDLTGSLPDQAALMGILQQLYNVGATLLTVECLEGEGSSNSGPGRRTG